jgi:hypothetical protein
MRLSFPIFCSVDEGAVIEVGSPDNYIAVDCVNENLRWIKHACNGTRPESWKNVC